MRKLSLINLKRINEGANLLGTGGGGTLVEGEEILESITNPVVLADLTEFNNSDTICTVFGVGGKKNCDGSKASQFAFKKLCQILKKDIKAIVPVETGTVGIAAALLTASNTKIPVLDSDIVGLRSAPEIYLETISLKKYLRTPCVVADDKGNWEQILGGVSDQELEKILRNFAVSAGGDAFVAGYPLLIGQLINTTPQGSVSECLRIGLLLNQLTKKKISLTKFTKKAGFELISTGDITSQKTADEAGFEVGRYEIKAKKEIYEILYKNENIVVVKNNQVVVSCPDSICLLDLSTNKGVNNFDQNEGKTVAILAKKAISIWRSKAGLKLFSPRSLGLNYAQVLLQ